MNCWLIGLLLLAGPLLGEAGTITSATTTERPYRAIVSVDETPVMVTLPFGARMVTIFNKAGNGIHCTTQGTLTAEGAPLEVGQTFTFPQAGQPLTRLECACAAAGTATLYLWAYP